ncbi:cation-independent mannose-6-phosphate receptor-like [Tribolium madens]|uniref:cation-independent mannose-6-phosphate receptor-like n=1 Tax=Tribolium madens TaxID=41895 RepID=UPI001CF74745|nr:cation-independent mannose-6-phosphate receptor-like [Tribolium madens]
MAVWLLTISLFYLILSTLSVPLILNDIHTSCEFTFLDKKKMDFSSKLWTIETRDFILHFSVCKSVQPACRNETTSCLFRKNSTEMIDLGYEFVPADSDDPVLVSLNGDKCPKSDQNYSISIILDCSDLIKPKPRLVAQDNQCSFEISVMKPDCHPRCTETVQDSLIDIRKFPKNILIESDSRQFSLSLCGSNKKCKGDVSACEINQDGTITPLASIDSQILVFNYGGDENGLTARGNYRKPGEVEADVHILIKCNWETNLANPVYRKVKTQGRHYKFELESTYGCIKLPHNCLLTSIHNLNYDLRKLYKLDGWTVQGVPQGRIFLNICGPLKLPPSLCSTQHSQVCHVIDNKYINKGSILSIFEATDEFITATFRSGSKCQENSSFSYCTQITIKCSASEKGPVFIESKDCSMFLIWETPQACPVDFYNSQNCYLQNRLSNRNLKKLYTDLDRKYSLSPNNKTILIYNLCGPIHQSCNNFTNVSFCLIKENKQIVIGYDSREIISDNGLLKMEFTGNSCLNDSKRSKIFVNLICIYENPPLSPEIDEVENDCKYFVTVFTPLACISQRKFSECMIHTNVTYDLSPLILKNKNYVIPGDEDIEYVFNVCGPVISGPGALCRGDTMFCKRNKSELNINNQYVSIGGVAGPRLQGHSLIIEAPMGAFCADIGYYKSVIYFECSEINFPPKFVSQESCTYNFEWKTPHACPQKENLTIENLPRKQKHVPYVIENVTLLTAKPQKLERNCTIFNTGYEFNLNELKSQVILHKSNKFQINFDQDISKCVGIFCKNYVTVVPQMCPTTSFNYSSQIIKLQYSSQIVCGSKGLYEFEVLLKCGKNKTIGKLFEDENCKSVVLYNLPEACFSLKQETVSTVSAAAIVGIIISILLLIIFIFVVYLNRRRFDFFNDSRCNSKTSVTIYLKDFAE